MNTQTSVKGEKKVSYDTKVLLIAIANIVRNCDNVRDIFAAIEEMANAEGVVLKPFEDPDQLKNES